LALNEKEVKQHQLISLKNTLEKYKSILSNYFESNNIATGFVYFAPENNKAVSAYFNQTDYFTDYFTLLGVCHVYCLNVDMVGFPNDCSFKLGAKSKDGSLLVEAKQDPLFTIEEERGKLIGNPKRSRAEQYRIEEEIRAKNYNLFKKGEAKAKEYFNSFASKIQEENKDLLNDFDHCIELCETLQQAIEKSSFSPNHSDIEKIYTALKDIYFSVPFETFLNIFSPHYNGEKITWLKSGPELKYFIDNLNIKLNLVTEINKWAGERFSLSKPISNMALYLGKQTIKSDYQLLIHHNLRRNPIFKLFME
jgi:hypothetical protein